MEHGDSLSPGMHGEHEWIYLAVCWKFQRLSSSTSSQEKQQQDEERADMLTPDAYQWRRSWEGQARKEWKLFHFSDGSCSCCGPHCPSAQTGTSLACLGQLSDKVVNTTSEVGKETGRSSKGWKYRCESHTSRARLGELHVNMPYLALSHTMAIPPNCGHPWAGGVPLALFWAGWASPLPQITGLFRQAGVPPRGWRTWCALTELCIAGASANTTQAEPWLQISSEGPDPQSPAAGVLGRDAQSSGGYRVLTPLRWMGQLTSLSYSFRLSANSDTYYFATMQASNNSSSFNESRNHVITWLQEPKLKLKSIP